jgi:D-glycero-D-manno-heptose 1,7-bisphosphate phosphatase
MKAVFLDRDGTLIVDPPDLRVKSVDEIELFPDTLQALQELVALDYEVFIITNQAGIGEGLIDEPAFQVIQAEVLRQLEPSRVKILATYMCPHVPQDNCVCRKPKPTMLLQAAQDFDIDMSQSWMIGDNQSDVMAGLSAGTKTILVQTGNNPVISPEANYTAPHLLNAVRYIAAGTI